MITNVYIIVSFHLLGPTCVNKPRKPENGHIYPTHNGAVLHYFCLPGYSIRGSQDVFCDGQVWDNNPPTCMGKLYYFTAQFILNNLFVHML